MPTCPGTCVAESGVQSLSSSVAGQARNQHYNLKKTQTRVTDPDPITHQEISKGLHSHLSLFHDSQSAYVLVTIIVSYNCIRNGRKVKFQYRSFRMETLSRPNRNTATESTLRISGVRDSYNVLNVLFKVQFRLWHGSPTRGCHPQ